MDSQIKMLPTKGSMPILDYHNPKGALQMCRKSMWKKSKNLRVLKIILIILMNILRTLDEED